MPIVEFASPARNSPLQLLLLVTKLPPRLRGHRNAKREASREHRRSDQNLSRPAWIVAGRYRAPHRIAALLPFARRKRPHRAVAGDAGENRRSHGHFPRRLFPRHGNAARPRNAKNAWRTLPGRNSLPRRNQALQHHIIGWRQAPRAGHDPQNGHASSSAHRKKAPTPPPYRLISFVRSVGARFSASQLEDTADR